MTAHAVCPDRECREVDCLMERLREAERRIAEMRPARSYECGTDFCDACGDCMSCYGADGCDKGGAHRYLGPLPPLPAPPDGEKEK